MARHPEQHPSAPASAPGTSAASEALSPRSPLSGHITALDGVRGLAILLVLIYHFTMGMSGHTLASRLFFRATSIGWCGVNLFFVLSGFLITGILFETKDKVHRFRNFYMRRSLRIFPLYYGSLLLILVFLPLLNRWTRGFQGIESAWPWLWSYGTNVLVTIEGQWFPMSHYWSLAVEEHFYLIWPWVVFSFSRVTTLRICLVLVAISFVVRVVLVQQGMVLGAYCLTLSRMDGLALGAFIALAARGPLGLERLASQARRVAWLSGIGLGLLMVWRFGLFFYDPMVQTLGYLLLDLVFASLIVLVVANPKEAMPARFFNLGVLRSLGRYSYGLYVYNSIFILLSDGLISPDYMGGWTNSILVSRLAYIGVAATSTFSMAWLSWHLFEKHFLKLKVFFEDRPIDMVSIRERSLGRAPA